MPPSIWSDPNADLPDDAETHGVEEVDFAAEEAEGDAPAAGQSLGPTIVSDAELTELLRRTYAEFREAIGNKLGSSLFPTLSGRRLSENAAPVDDVFRGVQWSAEGLVASAPTTKSVSAVAWRGRAVEFDIVAKRAPIIAPDERPRSPFWRNPFAGEVR